MKKLVLSLVAVAGMVFATQDAQAQVQDPQSEVEQSTTQQETQQQVTQKDGQDDFQSVDVVALPQEIKDAVMTEYTGAVTEEARVKEKDGERKYKLTLNVDGETKKVYADEKGNLISKDEKKDKKDEHRKDKDVNNEL